MIGKISKGSGFRGCLYYVLGRTGAEIIDTNMDGDSPRSLANEFAISRQLRPKLNQVVCHVALSLRPEEHLSNASWQTAIAQYLKEMGFTNNQYVAVKHTDKENHEHIHLVTSRVRMDGSVVSDSWDWTRSQDVIRKLEQDFGLAAVPSSWESDRQEQTKSQIDKELETGKVTVKRQLADKIDATLGNNNSLPDFIEQLNLEGIEVRVDRDRKGNPKGIAYKFDGVSMAGSSVGKAYSLPRILKRIESVSEQRIHPNISSMASHISQIIREQVKADITMPQLIEQLKHSGVDAHVKYTRTKKIKGISYSLGSNSIQGNELGKEFSWGGLQKYLQVSYEPARDRSIILEMQSADRNAVSQPMENLNGLSDSFLNELVVELEKQRSLKVPKPNLSENITKSEIPINLEQGKIDRAQMVAAICHQLLNDLGADSFGETGKNSYSIQRSGDALTVERLRGDHQIILQVKGQEIGFANLSEFDIQQFEQAWQHRSQAQQQNIDSQAKTV
ncbi:MULTISPECIES: relaxase/mobilization nuclease domain-containing protein [Pseudanabaena]|uniref:Relaxase/mobilization nuclease family protein n=2 Tax=Pseudanabaena TaxID=1152 RepID=L8N7V3_9CYAN|nr:MULTISPECIES: relaxase/mobilization nuclease domain-containing protein [Pseudanabaena]ELS34750.1 Relaxase/mobilization nuclease family protein [Pseudanabaena biceps PCC 7429]MDG3493089.1 relaxase/mobilization nuclease domain-containing protein [Pseudanabaena catenata USMAC16]